MVGRSRILGLMAAVLLGVLGRVRAGDRQQPTPVSFEYSGIRAVVVIVGEEDPEVLSGIRSLGANTVVTFARPNAAAAAAATAAGLRYIAFLSAHDVDRLLVDEAYLRSLRAIPNLGGFHYRDESVPEGYTTSSVQGRAYTILKGLFPEALVLYATRLDPVSTDPSYLDTYFRPEYSDLVTPYFYPVGTTVLGAAEESDPWEERLSALLAPLAERVPAGKEVLPVLQAFEQAGFPVGGGIAARQSEVYRRFWPRNRNVAAFWWGDGTAEPLVGLAGLPALQEGFRGLFAAAPARPMPRAVPTRPPS